MVAPLPYIVAPSILAGRHARLAESLKEISSAGAAWVHLDIMDGHFVPNLTFGPETVKDLRREAPDSLFFDVHLMLDNPHLFVEAFADAGANLISIHVEPEGHGYQVRSTLEQIHRYDCQAGLVLNPDTPVDSLRPHLSAVDLILVMTVQPGFGGQAFREDCLEKCKVLRDWRSRDARRFRIQVDGGVDRETAARCKRHGADTFVAGTAFFRDDDRAAFIADLQDPSSPDS